MNWLRLINQCFLLISLAGTIQSAWIHIKVAFSQPTAQLPGYNNPIIFLFVIMSLAIHNTHRLFDGGQNWLKGIARLCPMWLKIFTFCTLIYGGATGLFCIFLYVSSGYALDNWEYWRLREISIGRTILYYCCAVIVYASLRKEALGRD